MTAELTPHLTGREPRLITRTRTRGESRLTSVRLSNLLATVSPNSVTLEAARAMLVHSDLWIRYSAAQLLSRRGDRDARMVMQDILTTGEAPARASVARHLHGFSWFAAEPLIKHALEDPDFRVREGAVYALCDLRDLNAYATLTNVLREADDDLRMAAAWGLKDCQDAAAVPVLSLVLEATDPAVRIKGLEALGANDTPEAFPVTRSALNDPDPDVKYAATLSLLELAGDTWLTELAGIIGRTEGETRRQVLRGFFHATNYLKIDVARTAAADLLIDALESSMLDDMGEVRTAAILPLAWMKHERTPEIVRRAYFRELDPDVKVKILRYATSFIDEIAGELVQDGLKSRIEVVRQMAEQIMEDRRRQTH